MSLIPKVGRKSLKMRLVIGLLYLVLTAGAITMVYPFALMLGTSVTSGADMNDLAVVPRYLYSTRAMFPKYAEDRYGGDVDLINDNYGTDFTKIENITPPVKPGSKVAINDWNKFVGQLPIDYKQAGFEGDGTSPSKLRLLYQSYCRKRFSDDVSALNKTYIEENESFRTVTPPFERFKMREWEPDNSAKMTEWIAFKKSLPVCFSRPILVDPAFQQYLKNSAYSGKISNLNAAWGTNYKSFNEVHLAAAPPSQPAQSADWSGFIREQLPFRYMEIDPRARGVYQHYLSERYNGDISRFNARYKTSYNSFAQLGLPKALPAEGTALVDWMDFIAKSIPVNYIKTKNTENLYREHLSKTFGGIAQINRALGTSFRSIDSVTPPIYQADWAYCSENAISIRRDFATRNYAVVIDYMLLHGRAVINTVIFVFAVILVHLIVNPLCAYALSRYTLPYAYRVLLFLLATMAFPAEVAMIPNFLLLKQFHLLNTYWALILPGMANGYAIFLLKGFFDSLPKELYEAGIIDGASEPAMFARITIPMSKPIFAVIALQAFTGAYSAFMYAMLVCQDSKMWTMMVWLYQLQSSAPQYVTMAALTLAAIPTLFVFIFAQNLIMRGIIVPSLK